MIEGLFSSGAMPTLQRLVQFSARRHRQIVDNIANASTPNYRPRNVDHNEFQAALADAVERRRQRFGGPRGPLEMRDTPNLDFKPDGVAMKPTARRDNLLFHDRNDRSLEHLMRDLAENAGVHNTGAELIRNQFTMLETAIRERV
jgi:flagellar basal-body rod protein FlgB